MSLTPKKEQQAWEDLRLRVAETTAENSVIDDKRRISWLEEKLANTLNKVDMITAHYIDLANAYDRLVTQAEFAPFKTIVWGLCIFIVAVALLLLSLSKK